MSKIYSRKRFLIKPYFNKNKPVNTRENRAQKRIIKILIILLIAILTCKILLNYIYPVFESMCEDKAKSIATTITNQQSTIIMNNYKYDELYSIEKDNNGNIIMIKSNIIPINNMMSDLAEKIQIEFDKIEKANISIPIGSLTGSYLFSGVGPDIPIKVSTVGSIETDVKSEFEEQGINQTLHRVYVVLTCKVKILTPIKNYEETITNQVIVAEHVIIGNIPNTYYNLNGLESTRDSLEVIN